MIRRPPSLSSALGRPPMRVLLPPAWMTPVTLTRHTFTAPWRRTRGGSTVVSRILEGPPPALGPPSSTRTIAPPKYASTPDAGAGGSRPLGLASVARPGTPRRRHGSAPRRRCPAPRARASPGPRERHACGAPSRPGRRSLDLVRDPASALFHLVGKAPAIGVEALAEGRIALRQDLGCEDPGVGGSPLADRDRRHRDALRHLGHGQERVEPPERCGGDRHADHRQRRERREESGERGRAARARDEDAEPSRLGTRRVLLRPRRCPVRGGDDDLASHP